MKFDDAIKIILDHEKGYVNDPDDLGGETKFGITKRSYPHLDIKNLTIEEAIEIYRRDFWNRYGIDNIPASVRLHYFDMTVNAGNKNATRILQRALVQCGQNVTIDGVAGEKTLEACRAVDYEKLLMAYTIQRIVYYDAIVEARPKNKKFFRGWTRRALLVMRGV